ncbi:uncharacterized protein LOC143182503 [Calliopsis andreniformis]|uniref:uncharacterized protein LOC143182503 n=1 Tax=Calliopsis andreniformis TaxID=337506 RepID=UPI003FCD689B
MRRTSFLVLLCIFKCGVAFAICTVSKHEGGGGEHLQCSNASLDTVLNQTSSDVSAIMIFNSNLGNIQPRSFSKFSRSLQSLNIHRCQVRSIDLDAFDTLANLKKLSLPNNNISRVREEWFKDLVYLEQLDLSFNHIDRIPRGIFGRLMLLKRLDIRENRLTCLSPSALPGGIDKVYFFGNPLTFECRGKLTLWMRDHGVNYKTEQSEKETWLDKLLWHCAIDADVARSETLMKECVILELFKQLQTGLSTAESYPLSVSNECVDARNLLTSCIATEAQSQDQAFTNGNIMKKLLLYLRQAKTLL